MLTVNHMTTSGEEFIYPTTHINYVPERSGPQFAETPATVWHYDEEGRAYPLTGGKVFVMNDAGGTVAKYDLGGWSGPEGPGQNPPG